MAIKNKLKVLIDHSLLTDEMIVDKLIDIVYAEHKQNTLKLFLDIQERERKEMEVERNLMYMGLLSALGNLGIIGKHLLEDKTSREAKAFTKELFEGDNIAYLLDAIKVAFPKGKVTNHSGAMTWVFDKFLKTFMLHSNMYLNGISRGWAKTFNHTEYLNKVFNNHKDK